MIFSLELNLYKRIISRVKRAILKCESRFSSYIYETSNVSLYGEVAIVESLY